MTVFRLKVVLLAVTVTAISVAATEEPCDGENCKDLNLYLGPRWGTKTIRVPIPMPAEEKVVSRVDDSNLSNWPTYLDPTKTDHDKKYEDISEPQEVDRSPQPSKPLFPKRRPVPEDESISVDFMEVDQYRFRLGAEDSNKTSQQTPSSHWMAIEDVNKLFNSGNLNLTGFGLLGDQVKQALNNLSTDSKTGLKQLFLSRNQIRSLPKFCFTVEMEYELEELWLDHNPLSSFEKFTMFEISRLHSLKKLSLAYTGLRYLESLYIPSLVSLDLSGNLIGNYNYDQLEGLVNLVNLNMSHNSLRSPSVLSQTSLAKIRVLDLSNNLLTGFESLPLHQMRSLKELNMSNNLLKFSYSIDQVPVGVTLYLSGNPWECSCSLIQAVNETWWHNIPDKNSMRCTNKNIQLPWPVTSLREQDPALGCPHARWWNKLHTQLNKSWRWVKNHTEFVTPILTVLWWVLLFGCVVIVVRNVRTTRKHHAKSVSSAQHTSVPYNILDDKNVI